MLAILIMMLAGALRRWGYAYGKGRATGDKLRKEGGRMFYDIPVFHTGGRNQFRINERCPPDAEDFPLDSLRILNYDDTPDFDKIPKLQHGLSQLLDGHIHAGDYGFGKFPEINPELISQMSDYKPPSEDVRLREISGEAQCKYFSSTSNVSVALYHLYYILSMFRRPNFDNIYEENQTIKREHMTHFKKPATFTLKRQPGGTYSIDSDKGYSEERTNEVLLQVGTLGEYMLTNSASTIARMLETGRVERSRRATIGTVRSTTTCCCGHRSTAETWIGGETSLCSRSRLELVAPSATMSRTGSTTRTTQSTRCAAIWSRLNASTTTWSAVPS